jgi:hypothetical protein
VPNVGDESVLRSVTIAGSRAFAAGNTFTPGHHHSLAWEFDGSRWFLMPSPAIEGAQLNGISVTRGLGLSVGGGLVERLVSGATAR